MLLDPLLVLYWIGNAYDLDWLLVFLVQNGRDYGSIDGMRQELALSVTPAWYDRNAWGETIKRALPEE